MGKTFIQSVVARNPDFEKISGFKPTSLLSGGAESLKSGAKGLWNLAMGGKTHPSTMVNGSMSPGRWDPWHGLKNLGVVNETHTEGPLKGMLKYDPKTGDPVKKSRNPIEYIKQEFRGPKPTRADLYANYHASKAPVSDDVFEQHLKSKSLAYTRDAKGIQTHVPVDRPKGINAGEFMANASPEHMKAMGDINNMSSMDFIKSHPALAANWYGRNALHKGLFVGYPAYELGGVLTGNHPIDPEAGIGANAGASLGSTVGMVAGLPLGLVGGTAGGMALAEGGKRLGAGVDRAFNNRPMGTRPPPPPPPTMSPQNIPERY